MKHSYKHFFLMMAAHFVIMYFIMYTMINSLNDFYNNVNQVYMTLMMVGSMSLLMLWEMKSVHSKKMLQILSVVSFLILILGFVFMRDQSFVGDKQFLKSMIPHHSGAILMCNESNIFDPEIKKLCEGIVASQKNEIDQMKKILDRL